MAHNQSCIILKPTAYFLAFVADQLPDFEKPLEDDKPSDFTAYTIPVYENDEALLEHLERLYPYMFQYEVTRLYGEARASKVTADFLDFLCCFKFEVHARTLATKTSGGSDQQLVRIKPKTVSFAWGESEDPIILEDFLKAKDLLDTINSPTVLLKKFDRLDMKPLLQRYCRPLTYKDKVKKAAQAVYWPTLQSWQLFNRYFAIELHTQLVHLH